MTFDSLDAIRAAGFVGVRTIRELQATRCRDVPQDPGVYLVVRQSSRVCAFSTRSCGGWFKGEDPGLPVSQLRQHWVDKAMVIYVGKAGGGRSKAHLQQRLRAYMRFGAGEPVGHRGGRLIWQLEDCLDLIVCWRPSGDQDAALTESELIRKFADIYGRRPFANLRS